LATALDQKKYQWDICGLRLPAMSDGPARRIPDTR
jgi:hypothetical protein